jgi:DNA-binding beta-propeller fold protein YncE
MRQGLTRRFLVAAAPALVFAGRPALAASKRIFTVAGTGVQGKAGDGEAVATAKIDQPYGVEIAPDGSLIWADFGSNRVLRLDRGAGKIFVVAGTGDNGHAGDGGPAKAAVLSAPHEVRFDPAGNMYVAERDANVIRFLDRRSGMLSTLVGTGVAGFSGDGGPSQAAQLDRPHSIVLDQRGDLYICDIQNNRVRRRDAKSGIITTFAGNGAKEDTPDGAPLTAPLNGPRSIDIGPDGTMYLILREGNKVFALDPRTGRLRHLAGTGEKGYSGDGGPAKAAKWNGPKGIAYAPDDSLYISDTENHVIRKVSLRDGLVTTVAGIGKRGDGPDGDPLKCALSRPHGVHVSGGLLFIGDSENYRIRALEI